MSQPDNVTKTPLVGWRGWEVFRPCYIASHQTIWPVKERIEAICDHSNHDDLSPKDTCTCGIYAFKSADEMRRQHYSYQTICGEVYLWGKVIECEGGYRAQFAYPKKFYRKLEKDLDSPLQRLIAYIAWTYNIPLETVDVHQHPLWTEPPKIPSPTIAPVAAWDGVLRKSRPNSPGSPVSQTAQSTQLTKKRPRRRS